MSCPYSVHFVEHPTDAQIDAVVMLCLRAYHESVAIDAMTGGDKKLRDPLFRSMISAGALEGEFYIATTEDAEIVGFNLWFGPGKKMFWTEEQRQLGFDDFLDSLDPETRAWWGTSYKEGVYPPPVERAVGRQGALNSWYANIVATEPKYQRQGIATMLANFLYKKAIDAESFLCLGTDSNITSSIYQRMGFNEEGRMDASGPGGRFKFPSICLVKR